VPPRNNFPVTSMYAVIGATIGMVI
jgi:hypothetical protein